MTGEQQLFQEQRATLVAIAKSYLETPYVLGGRIKGVGVDCASFIACCLVEAGLAQVEDLGVYSHDWFAHADSERYMLRLLRHADRTLETVAYRSIAAQPGDIVLSKTARSRLYNHGGIVIAWPQVIHAVAPHVSIVDASTHPLWSFQKVAVFTPHFEDLVAWQKLNEEMQSEFVHVDAEAERLLRESESA